MASASSSVVSQERIVKVSSGWFMLFAIPVFAFICMIVLVVAVNASQRSNMPALAVIVFLGMIPCILGALISLAGFFTLQPNEARVLVLFGTYKGTVRESGFFWANPFYSRGGMSQLQAAAIAQAAVKGVPMQPVKNTSTKISLRARNMNTEQLKVNDKRGNPIEIAAVIVWRVNDTAQALFDVDDYENYVRIQSETAVRHLAGAYAYDRGEDHEVTLQSGADEVARELCNELQNRLVKAGVVVDEARLTHLAYAPEIAQAMLRRQQAEAVIAARTKIVHGAVSMVELALRELAAKEVVVLDNERKAAMVSNLLVVLCGESEVHPVVNTGTLYN